MLNCSHPRTQHIIRPVTNFDPAFIAVVCIPCLDGEKLHDVCSILEAFTAVMHFPVLAGSSLMSWTTSDTIPESSLVIGAIRTIAAIVIVICATPWVRNTYHK